LKNCLQEQNNTSSFPTHSVPLRPKHVSKLLTFFGAWMRFRLIKPTWGTKTLKNGKPNPAFKKEVSGPNAYEGNFTDEFLEEQNDLGYNIYFFPNETSLPLQNGEWMGGKHVTIFNYVYVDMDLKDGVYPTKDAFIERLKEFPLPPSWALDSGNGMHAYWKIKYVERFQFMELQKRLISHFNTDSSIWTALQLMRYPDFNNTKVYGEFKLAECVSGVYSDRVYSYSDFDLVMDPITDEDMRGIKEHDDMLSGRTSLKLDDDDVEDDLPEKFEKLLKSNPHVYNLFYEPAATTGELF